MAKKEILQNVGEVSPSLQPPAAFSATPSSGGTPPQRPLFFIDNGELKNG